MRDSRLPAAAVPEARVLVVDDEPANVALLERILEAAGYSSVLSLTDPGAFDEVLGSFSPDLILLDLQMPTRDGYSILEGLAARPDPDFLPVVVLTADSTVETRARALSLGAHDFVTKPFDPIEVLLRCRNLLETRALYRRLEESNVSLAGEVAARTDELRRAEAARQRLVHALRRMPGNANLTEAAAAICADLVSRPLVDVASVVALSEAGVGVVLASDGAVGLAAVRDRPLPVARARTLTDRSKDGVWVEPWPGSDAAPELGGEAAPGDARSAAYAPILDEAGPLGLIAIRSSATPSELEAADVPQAVADHAAIARAVLVGGLRERRSLADTQASIREIIATKAFEPVFQPVVDLEAGSAIGFESLTRFTDGARPDLRFAAAASAGVGVELEEACLERSVETARALPPAAWLSLNVSPAAIVEPDLISALLAEGRRLTVLEVTEHERIEDYERVRSSVRRLGHETRLAIDDAGAGFASFRHILELQPDFVKLDIGLVRAIDADPSRQALVAGMRYFAGRTGCTLIAEGIETEPERDMLLTLGIRFGQGYLLGRPAPLGATG